MSDTIVGALIAFLSASLGAGLTAIITWKTTKLSVDSDREHHLREEKKLVFSQVLTSYHALLTVVSSNDCFVRDISDAMQEVKLYTQFQTACENAVLICNKSSCLPIEALCAQAGILCKTHDDSGLGSAYKKAVDAMRMELGALEDQLPDRGNFKQVKDHQAHDN